MVEDIERPDEVRVPNPLLLLLLLLLLLPLGEESSDELGVGGPLLNVEEEPVSDVVSDEEVELEVVVP